MSESSQKQTSTLPVMRILRIALVAGLIVAIISYLDIATNAFAPIEQPTYGDRLEVTGQTTKGVQYASEAEKEIAVVGVSDDTYSWVANGSAPPLYFPREKYAQLVRKLTSYGAKVIAFDVAFGYSDAGSGSADRDFTSAIKQSGRVLLACGDSGDDETNLTFPLRPFMEAGCRVGHTRVPYSTDRPAIDDVEPVVVNRGELVPALSVEAVRMAKGIDRSPLGLSVSDRPVPGLNLVLEHDHRLPAFKIRYLCNSNIFVPTDLQSIVSATPVEDVAYGNMFRNKIVLIGDTTKLGDRKLTPVDVVPGVLIHANAVATILGGHYIIEQTPLDEVIMIGFLVGLTTILSTVWTLRSAAVLIILILPIFFVVNVALFVNNSYYIHLAAPSAAIILTALAVLLERGITEEGEKANFRKLLQRYVNPRIADHILKHPELIGVGGKKEVGTVLFSDIRDFTSLSEELPAEELVARMNEYFQLMTDVVFKHDGTAVSFVGDAMLAVFGIPIPATDHADRAVAAALEMQAASKQLQEKWRTADKDTFSSGIGINTGEVIFGEIGGKQLRSFTVYGLQVNIASRIEGLNKDLKTKILITEATCNALTNAVNTRGPISKRIKGVGGPVNVFEILPPTENL